jgi:Cellulase (glycosyl hydrolase family 5)
MKNLISLFLFSLIVSSSFKATSQPIKLHPENGHYFLYQNKPTVLVASTEHFGSVINPDFNYEKYLNTLKSIGLNHTRIWLGDYVEVLGDFAMTQNTSAPQSGKFLAPWMRSNVAGYAAGGNKFDLDKWNPAYFTRLHSFMQQASDKGIVVECILFFVGPNWQLLPMNPVNNINNTKDIPREDYLSLQNGNILDYQKKYCLKLIQELNKYDNVIFNIANEPWFSNQEHVGFASPPRDETKAWIKEVSNWIVKAESKLPNKHLISVDYTNEGRKISKAEEAKYWKNISVFNHHYDKDALSAKLNYGINKVMSFNETGLMPGVTSQYRIQGWKYLMSGGALYDNLDCSFEVGHEDGNAKVVFEGTLLSGCNDPKVKYELKALLDFMNSIDFVHAKPNYDVIACSFGDKDISVLENPGKEYAIYVNKGDNLGIFQLNILAGKYEVTYINPSDGKVLKVEEKESIKMGDVLLYMPEYKEDIAIILRIKK